MRYFMVKFDNDFAYDYEILKSYIETIIYRAYRNNSIFYDEYMLISVSFPYITKLDGSYDYANHRTMVTVPETITDDFINTILSNVIFPPIYFFERLEDGSYKFLYNMKEMKA